MREVRAFWRSRENRVIFQRDIRLKSTNKVPKIKINTAGVNDFFLTFRIGINLETNLNL
jgi:hypothetical protein